MAANKKSTMSPAQLVGLAVLAGVALVGLVTYMLILPATANMSQAKENEEAAVAEEGVLLFKQSELQVQLAEIEGQLALIDSFSQQFPGSAEQREMFDTMSIIASQSGVNLVSVQPSSPALGARGEEQDAYERQLREERELQEREEREGAAQDASQVQEADQVEVPETDISNTTAGDIYPLASTSMTITADADWESAMAFVRAIHALDRIFLIDNVSFTGDRVSVEGRQFIVNQVDPGLLPTLEGEVQEADEAAASPEPPVQADEVSDSDESGENPQDGPERQLRTLVDDLAAKATSSYTMTGEWPAVDEFGNIAGFDEETTEQVRAFLARSPENSIIVSYSESQDELQVEGVSEGVEGSVWYRSSDAEESPDLIQ